MGLDVWFREDVARVLRAAHLAGRQAQAFFSVSCVGPEWAHEPEEPMGPETEGQLPSQGGQSTPGYEMLAFWRGYEAALSTVSAAFGRRLCDEPWQTESCSLELGRAVVQLGPSDPDRWWVSGDRGERA